LIVLTRKRVVNRFYSGDLKASMARRKRSRSWGIRIDAGCCPRYRRRVTYARP
jgi:hypothetical protein